jgi:hypothetical protein
VFVNLFNGPPPSSSSSFLPCPKRKLSYKITRRRPNSQNHRQKKKKTPFLEAKAIFDNREWDTPQETTQI